MDTISIKTITTVIICPLLLHVIVAAASCSLSNSYNTPASVCDTGYENNCGVCKACDEGKYKSTQGNEECTECPANSNSTRPGAVSCECIDGYYRANNENVTVNCTGLPGAPRLIHTKVANCTSVTISWLPPIYDGGRNDLSYHVTYTNDIFTGPVFDIFETNCRITGLSPLTQYTISVMAVNGVSDQDSDTASRTITITIATNGQVTDDVTSNQSSTNLFIAVPITVFIIILIGLVTACLIICTNARRPMHATSDQQSTRRNTQKHDKTSNVQVTDNAAVDRYKTITDGIYYIDGNDLHTAGNCIYEEIDRKPKLASGNQEYLQVISSNTIVEPNHYDNINATITV